MKAMMRVLNARGLWWICLLLALVELLPWPGQSLVQQTYATLFAELFIAPGLYLLPRARRGALFAWAGALSLCLLYQGMASFAPGWPGDLAIGKSLLMLTLIAGVSLQKS